jgi:TRAP-type mannitol/chloroaromatic compound transport system permease small subunit|tara:strand:+ start:189 stop:698 length:510 start_codon:yes stop_codon:yes gene_type:complete
VFLIRIINLINRVIGETVSWLTLLMVLVTVLVVVLRYGFNIGFIWMQESVRFMYSAVFLLCAGYTLFKDKHVRVDVLYLSLSERKKAIVDLLGSIFLLLPVCFVIFYYSWSYVLNSWQQLEGSIEERGLHLVFLMKTFIWLFAILVSMQSLATIINSLIILKNNKRNNN